MYTEIIAPIQKEVDFLKIDFSPVLFSERAGKPRPRFENFCSLR
jgi:hypothetical protein